MVAPKNKVLIEEETIQTLGFEEIMKEASINLWKLIEQLRFHLIFYKIITGKGLEFDRIREYIPGDDARYIDWNSLAKTSKLFVKVFKEERMRDAIFLLDVSNTMLLGTTKLTKNEYASILLTTLAYACHMINDRISLICFSDKMKVVVEQSGSFDAVLQIAHALSKKETYGGVKNWKVLHDAFNFLTEDSYLFIISDFIRSDNILKDFIIKASSIFLKVLVIMLRDPIDSELPEGIGYIYLRDPETGEISLVNTDKIREQYNEKARKEEEEIKMIARAYGEFIKCYTNQDFISIFMRFFKEREREAWNL